MNSITPRLQVVGQLGYSSACEHRCRDNEEDAVRAAIWDGPGHDGGRHRRRTPACPERRRAAARDSPAASAAPTCASFYNGDRRIEPPWVLGHEITGEVIEIGPRPPHEVAASGISVGDAVHCISTLWCGRCRLCRSGNEHLCLQRRADGLRLPGRLRRAAWRSRRSRSRTCSASRTASRAAHATFADPLSDAICGHKDIAIGLDDTVVGDRRRPRRHGARRARAARRAPARCCCSRRAREPARRSPQASLGDDRMAYVDTADARRHRGRARGHGRTSAPTS